MKNLNPRQAKKYISENQPTLLDVREEWEFNICHIDGSILIPMRDIADNLHKLNTSEEILVICHHGVRSRVIAGFLESRGFKKTINLEGGLDAWADLVEPEMEKY
ncbi:MAG: sulfurtransferase [Gammaproteobacteria bacterium]|nr:sulfurtransferase [Gammaproteobacteria bacterium]